MNKKVLLALPLMLFLITFVFLFKGLFGNPKEIESGRIGQQMPAFSLPDLMDEKRIWNEQSLLGEAYLINVWGTWCPTCLIELPYLTKLREQGVKIVGLYYEQGYDPDFGDTFSLPALQQEVSQMLARTGDPYQFNILDLERKLALDLGVSGAPETFLIDKHGKIVLHHTGDINERVWRAKFATRLLELQ